MWEPFDSGKTISEIGSEGGIILKDEEMTGARITLEVDESDGKYSITCGIYGLMVHTAFGGAQEASEKYTKMKQEIEWFMNQDFTDREDDMIEWCETFTSKY